jgi:hypothetical protein
MSSPGFVAGDRLFGLMARLVQEEARHFFTAIQATVPCVFHSDNQVVCHKIARHDRGNRRQKALRPASLRE